jgi:Acetyltransferase (isoleucine patch superfamily)
MRLLRVFAELLKCNLIKTIKFNFKMLPLKQALHLPIFFYGKVDLRSLQGKVKINHAIRPGLIKIGIITKYVDTQVSNSRWTVNGLIVFNGPLEMARGSYVLVAEGATLTLGTNKSFYGSNLKIFCFNRITIGDCVRITWECQLYDTSFHYLELVEKNNEVRPLQGEVFIGNRVWIGNRTTISKGAYIPSDTIVASNSLVNKNFSSIKPYGLLAGCPAVLKVTGVKRVYDREYEARLDKQYGYHRTFL